MEDGICFVDENKPKPNKTITISFNHVTEIELSKQSSSIFSDSQICARSQCVTIHEEKEGGISTF